MYTEMNSLTVTRLDTLTLLVLFMQILFGVHQNSIFFFLLAANSIPNDHDDGENQFSRQFSSALRFDAVPECAPP